MIEQPTYDIFSILKDSSVKDYFKTSQNSEYKNIFSEGMSPNYLRDGYVYGDLRSPNFVTGSAGWIIRANGDVEFNDGTFRGTLVAAAGTIGGFTIGASTLVGGNITLNSSGILRITQSSLANTVLQLDNLGINFIVGSVINGLIYLSGGSTPFSTGQLSFQVGESVSDAVILHLAVLSANTGVIKPGTGDTIDLGDSTDFFREINYKTLTDRGCLGWFDVGVEMQNGEIVSDVEALKRIKKHPTKKTIYGVPMLDYSTMPKSVFRPAPIAETDILFPNGKVRFKKGEIMGQDGAETTALISILLGSIKELNARLEKVEEELEKSRKIK